MSKEFVRDLVLVVSPALIASTLTAIPFESILSVYPVPSTFIWYVPWRGATASIILWLLSGALYSDKRYWLKEFFLGSAASFVAFHYWTLFIVSTRIPVTVTLLIFTVGNSPPTLDLSQLVAILTLLAFRKEIISALRRNR